MTSIWTQQSRKCGNSGRGRRRTSRSSINRVNFLDFKLRSASRLLDVYISRWIFIHALKLRVIIVSNKSCVQQRKISEERVFRRTKDTVMIQGTIHDVIQIHLNQSSKTFFTSNDFNFARVLSLSEWITHNRFDLFFYHFYFPKNHRDKICKI